MYGKFQDFLKTELQSIKDAGLYKSERIIVTPQDAEIKLATGETVLNFCANNYLGLSSNPTVIEGAKKALDSRGYGKYDQDQGGQWVPTPDQRTAFQGVVLPVSDVDLRREITGTVTDRSEKIYTNGHALKVGAEVYDPDSDTTYTVTQELGHNSLHPLKRYLVEARGGAAAK